VTVCVRPEFISVTTVAPGHEANVFRGSVASLVFVGDAYEGEIIIGDSRFITRVDPTAGFREGDEVFLYFAPDDCSVLSR
jgi:iron(III) transport system ATP-binding protein